MNECRGRASITGLLLKLREIMQTGWVIRVAVSRPVLRSFLLAEMIGRYRTLDDGVLV